MDSSEKLKAQNLNKSKQKKRKGPARYFHTTDKDEQKGTYTKKSKDSWKRDGNKKHSGVQKFGGKRYQASTRPNKKQTYHDKGVGGDVKVEVFKVNIHKADAIQSRRKHKPEKPAKIRHRLLRKKADPFPGDKPIPKSLLEKYQRGPSQVDTHTRTSKGTAMFIRNEKKVKSAVRMAARTEFLMPDDEGFLEAEENESTTNITQHDLAEAVDITSAQKFFELKLNDFGPYRIDYTRNGRFLLLGGAKGHVAAIDWMTKKLLCEINVMETIHDVQWLHQETMYAVAQKQWTYMYDNQGIELHCLKILDSVLRMEFLPYHFLLASANSKGYLSYIDVSVGEKVAGYGTGMGRLDVMCQNPANAIIALGHSEGTVTQWCPKLKEPVVKMLCHKAGVRSVTIDKCGQYMATSSVDRTMKIWDLRTYKMLHSYKLPAGAGQLTFSQRGLLAACTGNIVQVYEDCCKKTATGPYLVHDVHASVQSLKFCPYEDVLGVGHSAGFSSLLVPGAGEPNFDALESNPYQTKKQRQEAEVKMLLDKIPAEMIHLKANIVSEVDRKTLQEKIEERNKIKYLEPAKLEYEPKHKKKGRSKGARLINRKKGVIEEHKRGHIQQSIARKQAEDRAKIVNDNRNIGGSVLDRFKRKELKS